MDVVVVQPWDDRCAVGIEHQLAGVRRQLVADLADPVVKPDIGGGAVQERGALNQHGASGLSSSTA